jgi:hypothetical protein
VLVRDHECGGGELVAVVDHGGGPGSGLGEGLAVPETEIRGRARDRVGVHPIEGAVELPVDLHLEGHRDLARHLDAVCDHDRGVGACGCDLGARVAAMHLQAEHQVVGADAGDGVPLLHELSVLLSLDERADASRVLGEGLEPGQFLGGEGLVIGHGRARGQEGQGERECQDQGSGHD